MAELAGRKDWRWPLQFAIVANFAVLGLFKYIDFGATILAEVTGLEFAKASLVLPIGISFYTFELVSYLVDRLRGTAPHYNIRVLQPVHRAVPASDRRADHAAQRDHPAIRLRSVATRTL